VGSVSGGTYGVGLLGLDTDLLEDDALGVGGTTEGAVKSVSPSIHHLCHHSWIPFDAYLDLKAVPRALFL
jgi:hypothetical protein